MNLFIIAVIDVGSEQRAITIMADNIMTDGKSLFPVIQKLSESIYQVKLRKLSHEKSIDMGDTTLVTFSGIGDTIN